MERPAKMPVLFYTKNLLQILCDIHLESRLPSTAHPNNLEEYISLLTFDNNQLYSILGRQDIDRFLTLVINFGRHEWFKTFATRLILDTQKSIEFTKPGIAKNERINSFLYLFASLVENKITLLDPKELEVLAEKYQLYFTEIAEDILYQDRLTTCAMKLTQTQYDKVSLAGVTSIIGASLASTLAEWGKLNERNTSLIFGEYFDDCIAVFALKGDKAMQDIVADQLKLHFGELAPTSDMLEGQGESLSDITSANRQKLIQDFQWHFFAGLNLRKYGDTTHKKLNSIFGITQFGRYPAEVLEHVAESYAEADKPSIVAAFARLDYSGDFLKQPYTYLKELTTQMKELGGYVRIIEFSTLPELWHRLEMLKDWYGKSAGLFIEGHGPQDLIYSMDEPSLSANLANMEEAEWKAAGLTVHTGANIVLNTCSSSGSPTSLAHALSRTTGRTCTGQSVATGLHSLTVIQQESTQFALSPGYVDPHAKRSHYNPRHPRILLTWQALCKLHTETIDLDTQTD